jgi:hypothetical protein
MEATTQKIAARALDEGRLYWYVTDQYGGPCNGGDPLERVDMPTRTAPGAWSPTIEHPKIRESGYHVTTKPWVWRGALVHLVEVDRVHDQRDDKIVCASRRSLAIVDPDWCIDPSIYVAARRPHLANACLPGVNLYQAELPGADLRDTNLRWADLREASLRGADLRGADLREANLRWADLQGARLQSAHLQGANLVWANLQGAYLQGAYLQGADLRGAAMQKTDLRWANLQGADLRWTDLYEAIGVDRAWQK